MEELNQQEMQKKHMELQMINQQVSQSQKQMEMLDNQIQDLYITKDALKQIGTTEVDTEILVPLAAGIFIKAKLLDNNETIVNVGSGNTVKKSMSESEELIDNQIEEITKFKIELESNITNLISKMQILEKEAAALNE